MKTLSQKILLYVVRHGETDWNAKQCIQGKSNTSLNETGRKQVWALKNEFDPIPFTACFSSHMNRALETALILTEHKNIDIIQDQRLREGDYGSWEGKRLQEFIEAHSEHKKDVESKDAIAVRVFDCLNSIASIYKQGNVLVVTHGGVIHALILQIAKHLDRFKVPNAAHVEVSHSDGRWHLEEFSKLSFS